jgi:hypothetical protein
MYDALKPMFRTDLNEHGTVTDELLAELNVAFLKRPQWMRALTPKSIRAAAQNVRSR